MVILLRVQPKDFNTYGARRGNDDIMKRGTFANIRLLNKFMARQMPKTLHIPSGETVGLSPPSLFPLRVPWPQMDVWDAAERYAKAGTPVIILAGKEYGSGSSRDWAAKGPYLQASPILLCLPSHTLLFPGREGGAGGVL